MELQGISYPVRFERGQVATAVGEKKVAAKVMQLLDTRPGELFMSPTYGCKLQLLVFEPLDGNFEAMAELYILDAIREWIHEVDTVDAVSFRYPDDWTAYIDLRLRMVTGEFIDMEYEYSVNP